MRREIPQPNGWRAIVFLSRNVMVGKWNTVDPDMDKKFNHDCTRGAIKLSTLIDGSHEVNCNGINHGCSATLETTLSLHQIVFVEKRRDRDEPPQPRNRYITIFLIFYNILFMTQSLLLDASFPACQEMRKVCHLH